jgi:anti-sigma regulatory factor (Ser/Thr protein kinase)
LSDVLRFPATIAAFEDAVGVMRRVLDVRGLQGEPRQKVDLAFEEIAVNVVRHARPAGEIEVTVVFEGAEVRLTFEDDGVPFDPRTQPPPTIPESLDDATVGGLGLVLVRRFVTRMDYERTANHHNKLTLTIPIN